MLKKIIATVIVLLCFVSIASVEAASVSNFIDIQSYSNIYKLSEDSDVKLPFIKVFDNKVTFDKKLDKSGMTFAASGIEITEDIKGIQTIISADSVDIKGSLEYGVILASNVVISGKIEKDIFILAESVFVTETASIGGDIVVMANIIELRGNVLGNFIGNSSKFLMEGSVQNDFRVCSENMTFNQTDIKGDIYIETNSELDISEKYKDAVINKIQAKVLTETEKRDQRIETVIKVVVAVVLFTLLNIVIRKIKPELFKNLANKLKAHTSYAIIMGLVEITTIPIIAVLAVILSLLGVGVVTTPLFIIYIAIVTVSITLAKFITGSVINEIIKEKLKIDNKFKELMLLIACFSVIYVLCYIPYIAWYMTIATILFSVGIILTGLTRKQ